MANGWQTQDIEGCFNVANLSAPIEQDLNLSTKAPIKIWKIIIASLVALAIIGGGVYFATQKLFNSREVPKLPNEQAQQLPEETVSSTPTQELPVAVTTLDCKQDFDCFIQASQNCKLVKVNYTATIDLFGVKQTTESFFEIKGNEAGKCNFYLRTEKIDLAFPASVPPEVISQQKDMYKKLEGRAGSCEFITSDLTAMLTKWKQGNFSAGDLPAKCQGTYFEQPSLGEKQEVNYADCGSSDLCFSDYVKTCAPAKIIISNQGLTYIETIEGYEGSDCILTLVYTKFPVPGFVGEKMTCKVPKSNLANFKDYLQGEKTMKQSCEGPLIDLIIQMGAE